MPPSTKYSSCVSSDPLVMETPSSLTSSILVGWFRLYILPYQRGFPWGTYNVPNLVGVCGVESNYLEWI